MIRVFRWSYLLPRLAVVALLLVFSEYGAGKLLRYGAQSAGQSAVGARVEIQRSSASLLKTEATLGGIAVADPRDPMTNLFEADRLTLDFDSAAALRKKAVVTQGTLTGIRFGGARTESGALPDAAPGEPGGGFSLSDLPGSDLAERYFDGVQDRFMADLQLESVRVAKELREKWPAEYQRLHSRAEALRDQIKDFTARVKDAKENPLRNVEFLQQTPNQIAALKRELSTLQAKLKALPGEVQQDRRRVAAAREHDAQLLREKLSLGSMDADSLSQYLVGEQIAGPVGELVGWLRWARRLAPGGEQVAAASGTRGQEIIPPGCRRTPDLLIRSLKLSGGAQLAGRPVEFDGLLTSLTTEPRVHGEPLQLTLTTRGAATVEVRATLDRTGETPVDELIADCPMLTLPRLKLGNAEKFGLTVAPSTAALSVSLKLTGERLAGDVQLVQREVKVTPHIKQAIGDVLAEEDLERALASRLANAGRLVTSVTLTGELSDPKWKVWSTAGPAVAEAMDAAIKRLAEQKAQALLAKGEQAVADQLGALDQELDKLNAIVTQSLGEPAEALRTLAGGAKGIESIGSRLAPMGSLFK